MMDISKIKGSDLWYIVGFIATDGYLSTDKRHLNITTKDRDHILKISKALNLNNKIGEKFSGFNSFKRYSQLQWGDVKLYRFLNQVGLYSTKSLTIGKLNVDRLYFRDFLRGVIDGDGCISTWIHKTNLGTQWSVRVYSASKVFIEWLRFEINKSYQLNGKIYERHQKSRINPMFILKYGKREAKVILTDSYYEGCLGLDRKQKIADILIEKS